jgi:NAD/NADP transhydrogenase alpha subunit
MSCCAVQPPALAVIDAMKEGAILVSFIYADNEPALVKRLLARKITCFAMERVPRISRAQSMDALSSQSALAGYYAAARHDASDARAAEDHHGGRASIGPAKVLVMGLGVAGLEAIATAHRLGAVVEGYDVRPETKEQALSLGRDLRRHRRRRDRQGRLRTRADAEEKAKVAKVLTQHIQKADLIITTAAIPGKASPKLISKAQVAGMKAGAVIVDLSAEGGGNCEDTARRDHAGRPGDDRGAAERALAARRGRQRAVCQEPVQPAGADDEGQHRRDRLDRRGPRRTALTHAGETRVRRRRESRRHCSRATPRPKPAVPTHRQSSVSYRLGILHAMNFPCHRGFVALYIFMLAGFAGWVIIGRVPAILHTPLMSGSNFVHGIVVVGGIYALLNASTVQEQVIGFVAVLLGAGNAAGGYAVTDRMLAMFRPARRPDRMRRTASPPP